MAVQETEKRFSGGEMEQRLGQARGFQKQRLAQGRKASRSTVPNKLARGLGWFSIGLGMAELLAPKSLGKLIGIRGHERLMRAFGMREIGTGIGILLQRQVPGQTTGRTAGQTARWLRARVAGDALDLAALKLALASEKSDRARVIFATAMVGGVTVLDALCSRQLNLGAGSNAVDVRESLAINRSPEECYRFWRDVENFPRFMEHLETVRVTGDNRSHWVAKAPAGRRIEWDAEITNDAPNESISWRSLEQADAPNSGTVRFERGPAGRGTIVRVHLRYEPPGGKMGALVAKLFGEEPSQQIKGDMRRFKQVLETGEIPTTAGQPAGPSASAVLRSTAKQQRAGQRHREWQPQGGRA